jgi:hypothetical protein
MKKYEFTYLVKQVDLQTANILVTYTPTDANLTAYTLNIPTYIEDENGQIKSIIQSITDEAPHHLWSAQELILLEMPNLVNSTAVVTPQ